MTMVEIMTEVNSKNSDLVKRQAATHIKGRHNYISSLQLCVKHKERSTSPN